MDYPNDIKDTVLVTHRSCLDGAGCAVMFLRAGGKEENIRFIVAGGLERFVREDLDAFEGRFLIVADVGFSSNADKYIRKMESRGNFVVMDHHKTSLHLQGKSWADVRQDMCGCRMLREYLMEDCYELGRDPYIFELSNVIDDNDRWLKKDPRSWELVMLHSFYGQQEFVRKFQFRHDVVEEHEREIVRHLKRRDDEEAEDAMADVVVCRVSTSKGLVKIGYVTSQGGTNSLMLHELLNRRPDLDVTCQINLHSGTVSLRSREGGVDVTDIAKLHGGGGHRCAAGHRLDDKLLSDVARSIHSGLVLED